MEKNLPGFNDKCKGCTRKTDDLFANQGYLCKAAYKTDCGVLLNPKITTDSEGSFNCESYKERLPIHTQLSNLLKIITRETRMRVASIQPNWPII